MRNSRDSFPRCDNHCSYPRSPGAPGASRGPGSGECAPETASGGCGICGCRSGSGRPGGLSGGSSGANSERLSLAGSFLSRLGQRARSLSSRANQQQLDLHQDTQSGGDHNHVWLCDVRALPCARSLYSVAAANPLSVRRHEAHTALQAARQRERPEECKEFYAKQALKEFMRKPFVEWVCASITVCC